MLATAICVATGASASAPPAGSGQGGVAAHSLGNFQEPQFVARPPGSRRLLMVVERAGRVAVLRDERRVGHDFLDITERVSTDGERGLLSIAFAPNYERTRRFYVYLTNNQGDIEVDEFRRSRRFRGRANEGSRRPVIVVSHPGQSNHNGGTVAFGPDGYLYMASGDGGGGGDPNENAQNPNSLLGKLLRIDPRRHGGSAYGVPEDNPFVDGAGRDEIYSLGLRNPFRFSFDARRNAIAIGDVGQNAWEEIDIVTLGRARGASFGWDRFEGNHDFEAADPVPPLYRPPILEYPNPLTDPAAVTGGLIVRDERLPTLYGRYLYADFFAGELRSFVPDIGDNVAVGDVPLGLHVDGPVAFTSGRGGRVYVASLDGPVYRLRPVG